MCLIMGLHTAKAKSDTDALYLPLSTFTNQALPQQNTLWGPLKNILPTLEGQKYFRVGWQFFFFLSEHLFQHYHSVFIDEDQSSGSKIGGLTGEKNTLRRFCRFLWGFSSVCMPSTPKPGRLFILMLPFPLGSGARVPGASGPTQNMACSQHGPLSAC